MGGLGWGVPVCVDGVYCRASKPSMSSEEGEIILHKSQQERSRGENRELAVGGGQAVHRSWSGERHKHVCFIKDNKRI